MAAWTRTWFRVVGLMETPPAHQTATVPPGLTTSAARAQNLGKSNQWAAVAAVRRSMLASGMGGERSEPSNSAVERAKRIGPDLARGLSMARADSIMPAEGS